MYTCVKLPPGDLNPGLYPPHLTSIYTYKVIIALKVWGVKIKKKKKTFDIGCMVKWSDKINKVLF